MRQPYLVTDRLDKATNVGFALPVSIDKIHELDRSTQVGFWLIDANIGVQQAQRRLSIIRQRLIPNIYLRPIVFLSLNHESDAEIKLSGCDAVLYQNKEIDTQIAALISKFEHANQWIDKLPNRYQDSETNQILRTLRLIVSRNHEIAPVITAHSVSGFIYPLLETITQGNDSSFFNILDFLETQKLIVGNFISHCHLCCQCHCAFLNFKEICPQCKSEDITSEELIHHFKCAHVAKKSAFQQKDSLYCPKCDRELKHIGVDYDKPSVINHCNRCATDFQEAEIITECFNCHNSAAPEDQIKREIKAYRATAIGANAAIFGLDNLFTKIISAKVKFFTETQFKQFLEIEIERIKRYQLSTSSLGLIKFIDIEKIYLQQGERSIKFFEELSTIFKSILRLSDVVSTQGQALFMIILTETSKEKALIAMKRIMEGLSVLLSENMHYTGSIPYEIEEINSETNLDQSLEQFVKKHVG